MSPTSPTIPVDQRQLLDRLDLDAPTRVLVWRRFRRHRLGVRLPGLPGLVYAMLPFVEPLAPYPPNAIAEDSIYTPPQGLHLWHEGEFIGLHTYPAATEYDLETGLVKAWTDHDTPLPVPVFATCGKPYRLLGLIESRFHVICPPEGGTAAPARLGPAGARRPQPHPVRRAAQHDDRADRRHRQLRHRPRRWAASPAISAAGSTRPCSG